MLKLSNILNFMDELHTITLKRQTFPTLMLHLLNLFCLQPLFQALMIQSDH